LALTVGTEVFVGPTDAVGDGTFVGWTTLLSGELVSLPAHADAVISIAIRNDIVRMSVTRTKGQSSDTTYADYCRPEVTKVL
jgi:hypothetical protein